MKTGDGLTVLTVYSAEHYCTRRITAVPPSVAPAFMMMESTLTKLQPLRPNCRSLQPQNYTARRDSLNLESASTPPGAPIPTQPEILALCRASNNTARPNHPHVQYRSSASQPHLRSTFRPSYCRRQSGGIQSGYRSRLPSTVYRLPSQFSLPGAPICFTLRAQQGCAASAGIKPPTLIITIRTRLSGSSLLPLSKIKLFRLALEKDYYRSSLCSTSIFSSKAPALSP